MARPLVVIAEDLDCAAIAWLRERCDVVECAGDDGDGLRAALARADGLVVRTYTRVDGALLASAPRLRVVGRAGVGLDNVGVPACRSRGVEVVHTPDANSAAVAEYVLALLLDRLRPRQRLTGALPLAEWTALRRSLVGERQLSGLRLGVTGLGRVGRRVARAARGFGMDVIYTDLAEVPESLREGARGLPLADLLATSDIISLHVDARESNRHFIDAPALARMKPDAVLVNTSRGFVIDSAALAAHLAAHPRATAIIDVHDPEPFDAGHPLLRCPNAHLYPHLGAATRSAHAAMSWVVRDVWRVLNGEQPEWPAPR
jgi:phosphoglycerate dehydrogenase-like enzyme